MLASPRQTDQGRDLGTDKDHEAQPSNKKRQRGIWSPIYVEPSLGSTGLPATGPQNQLQCTGGADQGAIFRLFVLEFPGRSPGLVHKEVRQMHSLLLE